MPETANELRQRASRLRFLAQRANGQAYHDEMQTAEHLEKQAEELEKNQQVPSPVAASPAPHQQNKAAKEKSKSQRKNDLAKIHLLKKKASMDEDTYRDMLEQITGKRSSTKMTGPERLQVIKHLQSSTRTKKSSYPGRPNNTDTSAQMKKIEAQLTDAKLPWSYAKAIAKRQCGKGQLEFCDGTELTGVINALIKKAEKEGRRT